MKEYDVVVIGGGSAGLTVSIGAAQFGLKVLLIEAKHLGGECLNSGCVPSKALIKAAHVAKTVSESSKYGVHSSDVKVDFSKVMEHVRGAQDKVRVHEDEAALKKEGVDVLMGKAKLVDRYTVEVTTKSGKKKHIKCRKVAICTGSRPRAIPIKGLDKVNYLTNENMFLLKKLPKSLGIIGGGAIGCEMAQAFSRLGCKVTMFLQTTYILDKEDREVSDLMTNVFAKEGISFVKECKLEEVKESSKGTVIVDKGKEYAFEKILVATGRMPNIEGLGLDDIEIKYTKRGITVNKSLQTSVRNIYAVGDVNGTFMFSHYAFHEGVMALKHMSTGGILGKRDEKFVPWTTFTSPEVARAGYSEEQAKEAGISYEVVKLGLDEVDRSVAENDTTGFIKLLIRKNKLIGIHVVGPRGGEVFHELYLAMKNNLSVWNINSLIHVYPTHSESLTKITSHYLVPKIFVPLVKKIAQVLVRYR